MAKLKRIMAMLIALLMLVPTLASCSDNTPAETKETTAQQETAQTAESTDASSDESETEDERIKPNIPESADFGGAISHSFTGTTPRGPRQYARAAIFMQRASQAKLSTTRFTTVT